VRNAIVRLPEHRTDSETRRVLRAAIRQLERADVYLAAVEYMDLDDRAAGKALTAIRADVEGLRRHLADERARMAT
jgi:ABC-type phosphate transport system auxiliary subunit